MIYFLSVFLSFVFSVNICFAGIDQCIAADKVSREFTLAAVKGDFDSAWKFMDPDSSQGKERAKFIKEVKHQFRRLLNKEVLHSTSTPGLEQASCLQDKDHVIKFRDHRLLLHFNLELGNGIAEVLPISVEVHLTKKKTWKIHRFASTVL